MDIDIEDRSLSSLPPRPQSHRPQSAPPTARKPTRLSGEIQNLDYSFSGLEESWHEGFESPQFDYSAGFDTPEPTNEPFGEPIPLQPPRFMQSLASVRCAEGDHVQMRARVSGFPKPRVSFRKSQTKMQQSGCTIHLYNDVQTWKRKSLQVLWPFLGKVDISIGAGGSKGK